MTDLLLAAGGIVILLALDLTGIAARTSFLQITQARLLMQRDEFGARAQNTLGLLGRLPRLRASLNLLLVLTRFLIAGISLFFISTNPVTYPWLAAGIGLFVAALLVFWLEWAVERLVSRNSDAWAIRLTGFVAPDDGAVWLAAGAFGDCRWITGSGRGRRWGHRRRSQNPGRCGPGRRGFRKSRAADDLFDLRAQQHPGP